MNHARKRQRLLRTLTSEVITQGRLAGLESKHRGVVRLTGGDCEPPVKSTVGADAIPLVNLPTNTSSQFKVPDTLETPLLLFERPLTLFGG